MDDKKEVTKTPEESTTASVLNGKTIYELTDYERKLITDMQAKKSNMDLWRSSLYINTYKPMDVYNRIMEYTTGMLENWVALSQTVLDNESTVISALSSRLDRVIVNDWKLDPASKDPDDILAAEFLTQMYKNIPNLYAILRSIADGIYVGFSAHQLEWGVVNGDIVVKDFKWINQRRLRYAPDWSLRYYNYGEKPGKDGYGEELWQDAWIIFNGIIRQGDPCYYGLLRCILPIYLELQFIDRFWIDNVERFGSPHIHVHAGPNCDETMMALLQAKADAFNANCSIVTKGDTEVNMLPAAASQSAEAYEKIKKDKKNEIFELILGSSDVNNAGDTGSKAAVNTRTEAVVDPKRDNDALMISSALGQQVSLPVLKRNRHKFANKNRIPGVPIFKFVYPVSVEEVTAKQQEGEGIKEINETPSLQMSSETKVKKLMGICC